MSDRCVHGNRNCTNSRCKSNARETYDHGSGSWVTTYPDTTDYSGSTGSCGSSDSGSYGASDSGSSSSDGGSC